jgi:hypothetical protein
VPFILAVVLMERGLELRRFEFGLAQNDRSNELLMFRLEFTEDRLAVMSEHLCCRFLDGKLEVDAMVKFADLGDAPG